MLPTLDDVRREIRNRPATITLNDLSAAADCSISWLNQFLADAIPKPGYDKIQKIYNYLMENKNK